MSITRRNIIFFFSRIMCVMILLIVFACDSTEVEPEEEVLVVEFVQPASFPLATYTFENNAVTTEGFTLGRMLFYDPVLSVDSTVSCSTCHRQNTGFADPTHRVNHGVGNKFGKRNSPSIANMAFRNNFFFDGGANHLDFVPINAITSEVEMGNTLDEVIKRLQGQQRYRDAFVKAFNRETIDSQQLLKALSQFTVMMVSDQSKYDQVNRGEATFTADEAAGLLLFQQKCSTCHATDLFTDDQFRNNGLDKTFTRDPGRKIITALEEDAGKFRVPSLRDVAITPPYMHDGRFVELEEVLEHYASGVKDSPTLDPLLRGESSLGIELDDDQKRKIVAFLKTLTDQKLLTDKKFTDPFR